MPSLNKYELIQDAFQTLQREISPDTGIQLDMPCEEAEEMANLLFEYGLPTLRSTRLLSIYIAIKIALLRHSDFSNSLHGENLTRKVLDGDYLYSFYVQLCLQWNEYDLLAHLAPVIKQIQIRRIEGSDYHDVLLQCWELFLELEKGSVRKSRAM
ncbi:hypothetical protein [Paenibacillus antibioticophila]|uniref:hypothetical protein n=1 Tax=Paenibacillus antibioticophila TaxID=1274374 RepID=UPI0020170765|nr:hypothetical protein [Paenibacillus antibioticophila]